MSSQLFSKLFAPLTKAIIMTSETTFITHTLSNDNGTIHPLFSEQTNTPSEPMHALLEQFNTLFHSRSGRLIGELTSGSPCRQLTEGDVDELVKVSRSMTSQIASSIDSSAIENRVMLLFVRWKSEMRDRFIFAWVEPVEQWSLDENSQPQRLHVFGPASLRFGLHVDFAKQQVFGLPSRPVKTSQEIFPMFGFESTTDTKTETDKLMGAFEQYCQKMDDSMEVTQVRQKAYDYCTEQVSKGEQVDLRSLSAEMSEQSPEKFFDYLGDSESEFEPSVPVDARRMKQMIRFSGSMKGVSISFSEFMLGEQIVYDSQQESLLIRDLPPTLKKQLKRSS